MRLSHSIRRFSQKTTALALALLTAALPLMSCSGDTDAAETGTRSDTAGIADTSDTAAAEEGFAPALTLYVDIGAAEGGDGTQTTPYRTLQEANDHIQSLRTSDALPDGGILVSVAEGEYVLPSGFSFSTDGYGTEACPIVWESEVEHGAVLTAGTLLDNADFVPLSDEEKARIIDKEAAERLVKVDLKTYGKTVDDWGRLYSFGTYNLGNIYDNGTGPAEADFYCNGDRLTLAKYPNEGYSLITRVTDTGAPLGTDEPNPPGPEFIVSNDVTERMKQWQSFEDIWTYGYFMYDWADASNPVADIISSFRRISLGHIVFYGIRDNQRYYLFNIFEELDAPGEYFLDRDNGIFYFYPPEDLDNAEIIMSDSDISLVMGNVSHFTFRGFSVCGTGGKGIDISGHHANIENCKVYGIRSFGINVHGTDMTVSGCEVSAIGGAAIRVNGGDNATLTKSNNRICGNYIHDWAQIVKTSQNGVEINGCGVTVCHNELAHAPHEAMKWNGAYHTIEYNNIHHVCQDTSDCGALYAGRNFTSYGTQIRYNYIHDIGAAADDPMRLYWDSIGGQLAEGLYWDDGIGGQTAYGNIFENITGHTVLIGGGRDHVFKNNIIINSGREGLYYDSRVHDGEFTGGWYGTMASRGTQFTDLHTVCAGEQWKSAFPHLSTLLISSVGVDPADPALACNPSDSVIADNVIYHPDGSSYAPYFIADMVTALSDITLPCVLGDLSDFADYENGDLNLTDTAAVLTQLPGFEKIPFNEIGLPD